ncbi:MAG: hypothetical protein JST54_00995 [Deltaproteobacteria bacterium]|nr:hypothetical protein [Deltaproteobacteria bacterium]
MSRSTSEATAAKSSMPTTVDQALGPLTQQAVDNATDATNKKYLSDARAIALGLVMMLIGDTDPQDQAVVQLLADVNLGMRDVLALAALAGALISAASDRDAAEAAARAATAKLEAARTKLHDATTSFANLARGKLGPRSPALEKFGIKPLGGRKGVKRVSKKNGASASDSTATPKT